MMDPELVDTVSAALEQSERVDDHRILVTATEDGVAMPSTFVLGMDQAIFGAGCFAERAYSPS